MTSAVVAIGVLLAASGRPGPGQKAPSFTLDSSEGKAVSLRDLRGHTLVLAFFPKAFTSG